MKDLVNDGFARVVKPYIDTQNKKDRKIIAPVEVSPAEVAHIVGDQIIFDGILYDVTAQIAVGDPLATTGAGANISAADNIETQLKSQKTQIESVAAQAAAQNKTTQEMLATVEEDETDASRAYAIGEQLILDGILYNVIDSIAQHGIITAEGAGANIEAADTITEQIGDQGSSIQTLTSNKADKTQISNPNLWDNPWFTVNQRGQSTYASADYTVDRWQKEQISETLYVNSGYLSIIRTSTGGNPRIVKQKSDRVLPAGTYTASVKFRTRRGTGEDSGYGFNIYDGTITTNVTRQMLPVSDDWSIYSLTFNIESDMTIGVAVQDYGTNEGIAAIGDQIDVACIKLERGSVSTLAMDTAPNYAEELLKCQRYFVRLGVGGNNYGVIGTVGYTTSATDARIPVVLPVPMRTNPTVTKGGNLRLGYATATASTSITDISVSTFNNNLVNLDVTSSGLTADKQVILAANNDTTAYIDLSADL